MTRTLLTRIVLLLAGALITSSPALAQADACAYYRGQLAELDRSGGGRNYAALAQRQRQELGRMAAYRESLGCEQGRFLIFGPPPSAECRVADERIRAMEANYSRLMQQAQGAGDGRRQAILASIDRACNPQRARRGLFEGLFGPAEPPVDYGDAPPPPPDATGEEAPVRIGGGRPVCVRACDGSFFPLNTLAGSRGAANDLCQALCPGTETSLFYLPGDSDLKRAVSGTGQPYVDLPNAFKFRSQFDASCTCRKPGESWAEALRNAEAMIERKRGDILVTAQKADELSRAKDPTKEAARKDEPKRGRERTAKTAEDAEQQEAADAGAAAPTAGTDSSGIGPQAIGNETVLGRGDGQTREVTTDTGAKRRVRVVAPTLIPPPNRM